MKKRKIIIVALVTACMTVSLAGCTTYDNFKNTFFKDKNAKADTVTIGVIEPTTGEDKSYGETEIKGIELAHSLYGKVLGKKVELVYEDTQSSIYTTESVIKTLLEKNPAAILGSYGDASSLAVSEYLEKAKVPGITPSATNPLITENNGYYFRMSFSEASQGTAIADYIGMILKENNVALITLKDDDTVNDMVNNFTKEYSKVTKKAKGKVEEIQMDKNGGNIEDCIKQLESTGAKTVFMPTSLNDANALLSEIDRLKISGLTFVGPKEWHTNELISLQNKYKGIKISAASDYNAESTDTKYYDEYVKAYKSKYGSKPQDQNTALAFDAYMVAINAIEKAASTNGTTVRDALAATKNYSGASGVITFDESGNPKKPVNIDIVKNSIFKTVYTVE